MASRSTTSSVCYNWDNTGSCKYGDNCRFQHGEDGDDEKRVGRSNYDSGRNDNRNRSKYGGYNADSGYKSYGGSRGVCYDYRDGKGCRFGNTCKFTHDDGGGDDGDDGGDNYDGGISSLRIGGGGGGGGRGVCYNWRDSGSCRWGEDCKFTHGEAGDGGGGGGGGGGGQSQNICYNWKDNKTCQFGDNCRFIHRDDGNDYRYKPRSERTGGGLCNNFRNTGKCRFGGNCKFIHEDADADAEEQSPAPATETQ